MFIIIGVILLIHWIALVIHRITTGIFPNIFFISHLALLLAAIGFFYRNNLLLSGSLIAVLIGHALWVIDLLKYIITGTSYWQYSAYFFELTWYAKLLTLHHVYLIPLLIFALWKQKKFNINGWLVASLLYVSSSLISLLFLPRAYNINCAHFACPVAIEIFPFLETFSGLGSFTYFIVANLFMAVFAFLIPSLVIWWGIGYFSKTRR